MQLSVHDVIKIKAEQRHHGGSSSFFCLELEVETKDQGTVSVRLFSEQPMTLVNPAIIQVG